jgi:integrase
VVPTVAQVMAAYREGHVMLNELDNGSWRAATYNVEHADIGKLLATEVTPLAVTAYGKARAAGRIGYVDPDGKTRGYQKAGPAAFRNDMLCLNAAMRWCILNRLFSGYNMANLHLVKAPPAAKPKDHFLTIEEADTLQKAAKARDPNGFDPLYIFISVCLDTATRATALEELTWDRVTLKRGNDGLWSGSVDFRVPGRRETKKRRGVNQLSTETAALLADLRATVKPKPGDPVIGYGPTIQWRFRRLCKSVLGHEEGPHILRHSWATWAVSSGMSLAHVGGVLHDTPATVSKHYGHLTTETTRDAVAFVAELRRRATMVPVDLAAERSKRTDGGV